MNEFIHILGEKLRFLPIGHSSFLRQYKTSIQVMSKIFNFPGVEKEFF